MVRLVVFMIVNPPIAAEPLLESFYTYSEKKIVNTASF